MLSTRGPGDEVWRNGGTRSLDGWMRKARLMPPSSFDPRQENCSSPKGPTPTGCQRRAGGGTRAAQQHLGPGGKKLRKRKSSASWPRRRPAELPRPPPLPAGAHPRPSAHAARRGPRPSKLPPKSRCARPAGPAPIPTKFPEPLPPGARPAPDNRWAAAPAGPGLSWPGPLHSFPAGAPGRPAPGRGGELAPLPPPYLPS